jgi:type I restriction enzyme, S subunit
MVPLGQLLRRSGKMIELLPDIIYREVTVRVKGKGVVERRAVAGLEIASDRRHIVSAGQFILSKIDARHGASGIIPDSLDGAVVTNDFPLFNVVQERLVPKFLEWMSKTAAFIELCGRASEGTTNRVRLSEQRFLALEIPLPHLAEQRRIVARIDALATKIAEARGLRKDAEVATAALLLGARDNGYCDLLERFGSGPLASVCTSITDGDHLTPLFAESGVKFIFVGNVSSGRLHFDRAKQVDTGYFQALSPNRVPRRGDILYSAVGATLGIPVVVDTDDDFCFQRHIAILKLDKAKLEPQFVWHMLTARTVFAQAWRSTTGSAQPTIPLRAIRALQIPIPLLTEQRRIVAELDALQAKIDAVKRLQAATAAELDALLPAILDRAFKGEL